jgi:citrate lyase subunit beta / citryl-CoA lyase
MLLLKSWLFVPGSKEKHIKKAKDLEANALIYDLEDSVTIFEKENARLNVAKIIQDTNEKVNFVRVNNLNSPYFMDDLYHVVREGLTGIVLPKVNDKENIIVTDYILSCLEKKHQLTSKSISIVPIIETAVGLQNAFDIATSSKRVTRLAFGAQDFMLDLNIRSSKEGIEILYARSKLVAISRAANLESPIDTVYLNYNDEEGLEKEAQMVKQLGFQGKLLIHPNQIKTINQIFSPTSDEIEEAKKIVKFYDESITRGVGAIEVDGKMVDLPIAERARRILSYADFIE